MASTNKKKDTPLSREMKKTVPTRTVRPRDALNLAAEKWAEGKRIEMGSLADELGVGRATLFRWVGSRELLLGEVLWSVFEKIWNYAVKNAKGVGGEYAAEVTHILMKLVLQSSALRTFIDQDPEYALRILTSRTSTMQMRIAEAMCQTLREQEKAGHIRPALEIEALAYVMLRIVESCLYSDQISGRKPDINAARDAIRILVSATPLKKK